jgi:molybdate transport system regulatory protein
MKSTGRYPGLTLRVLGKRAPAMGPGRAALLEKIAESGSISAAARDMGMSYRRAWQLVESINKSFSEPLVVTETGGKRGGGARVTELGVEVLRRFRAMESRASAAIAADLERFSILLKTRR